MTNEEETSEEKPPMSPEEATEIIDTMVMLYVSNTGGTRETAEAALNVVTRLAYRRGVRGAQVNVREAFSAAIARVGSVFTELDTELHRRSGG